MRRPPFVSCLAAACCLWACNGPKETCEGSARSFYRLLEGHDWEELHAMLTPEFKHKHPDAERFGRMMEEVWKGSKGFSVKWNTISPTRERICIANGLMSYTTKLRGESPRSAKNEYFSWTLRQGNDERWYVDLPGQERISGY